MHERGWPEFCDTRHGTRIDAVHAETMGDIMPSRDLVFHQWRKHGSCSGLSPKDYFALAREAHSVVTVPKAFRQTGAPQQISVNEIERQFIAANPGLQPNEIAVTCSKRYLRDVRICLNRDLTFRPCAEVDRNSCRESRTTLPPTRG
jgi:ribonuclease T2